jgi:hypothetical protein
MATAQQPLNDTALVLPPPNLTLAIQRAPEVVLAEAAKAAQALRQVIESKPNKCVINGKTFLQFEDWQTLGRFYGITAAARTTSYLEQGRVRGYECHAEAILVSADQVIGAAQAMCMDDEDKWRNKPLFQLRSMAQTRAQAKALRGVLAWVAVLAGYSPTPAEEVDGGNSSRASQPVRSGGRLESSTVADWCQRIGKAANYEQLQDVFRAAYSQASEANDQNAQAAYIAAKDQRRKELR